MTAEGWSTPEQAHTLGVWVTRSGTEVMRCGDGMILIGSGEASLIAPCDAILSVMAAADDGTLRAYVDAAIARRVEGMTSDAFNELFETMLSNPNTVEGRDLAIDQAALRAALGVE